MNTKTIAEQVEVKLHIHAKPPRNWNKDEMARGYGIDVDVKDYASIDGWILVATHDVIIDVPAGFDIVNGMVKGLREKQSKIRARAEVEANAIEAQIQSMLCITHEPDHE